VEWNTHVEIEEWIETKKNQIQCVVNKGTDFGMSQYPSVDIFEDDINLLEVLTSNREDLDR